MNWTMRLPRTWAHRRARRLTGPIVAVIVAYVLVGAAWMLLSEWALDALLPERQAVWNAILHGLGFVTVSGVALYLILGRMVDALQHSMRERLSLATEVRSRATTQRLLAHQLMRAEEETRRAVAKDLHDGPLQMLTLSFMQLDAAIREHEDGTEFDRERIGGAMDAIRNASAEIRAAVRELHPPLLAELGLAAAIERHCREVAARTEREVRFYADEELPAPLPAPSIALFRIAQEALANAAKHTRDAPIQVSLTCDHHELHLEVEDEGPGVDLRDALGAGLGLVSMRERAASVGGRLELRSSPSSGTSVRIRLPLDGAVDG